jgi:hypothetical protein
LLKMLRGRAFVWILALLTVAASPAWSQANSVLLSVESNADAVAVPEHADAGSQTSDSTPQRYGPSIDPLPESRSLFLAGLYLAQGLETYPGNNQANSSQVSGFARALGSLDFLKIGHRFETAIDYRGGGFFNEDSGYTRQLQQLQATGRFFWQKTALTLSDSLGNYPGGSFGSSWFGGASAYNLGSTSVSASLPPDPGLAEFIGSSNFGIGQNTLTNVALAELTESLTKRSSVTVAGAYGIGEYFGENPGFINSRQVSALVNYGHVLTPRSEIGVVYGYRSFQFPEKSGGHTATQVAQFTYSRILSRRLQLQAGAGPEFSRVITPLNIPNVGVANVLTHQINVSAYGAVAYSRRNATMTLSYYRLVTSGSGLFGGANSDVVQFSLGRRLFRSWQASFDAGYVRLVAIQQSVSLVPGNSYQYGYAGVAIRRKLGQFHVLASYQFNDESFNTSFCAAIHNCSLSQRNVGLVGIYRHTRPIHLDHGSGHPLGAGTIDNDRSNTDDSDVPSSNN